MSHLHTPGPLAHIEPASALDDGTNPRMPSPVPGPVGLDSKGGGSGKGSEPSIAERILGFTRRNRGQRVGDGECFTLADQALRGAGARSAADYGGVSPNADYVWGDAVALTAVRPGDVVQFRDYQYQRDVERQHPDGSSESETQVEERPHHTAIVETVGANGEITVLEQNAPQGGPVVRTRLYFASAERTAGGESTTIRVRGSFWFYRPQAR
jgi:hypothetical protein